MACAMPLSLRKKVCIPVAAFAGMMAEVDGDGNAVDM